MIRCGAKHLNLQILFGLDLYGHKEVYQVKGQGVLCLFMNKGVALFLRLVFVLSDSGYRG